MERLKHFEPQLKLYVEKKNAYEELKDLSKRIRVKSALVLNSEMKSHNRVIKRFGLVDKGVITLKGRVTCEINSNHEILLTDLVFTGFFNDMTPVEIAALMSSLVHE
jgi:ATP-dependent RNA helicase DOB1